MNKHAFLNCVALVDNSSDSVQLLSFFLECADHTTLFLFVALEFQVRAVQVEVNTRSLENLLNRDWAMRLPAVNVFLPRIFWCRLKKFCNLELVALKCRPVIVVDEAPEP